MTTYYVKATGGSDAANGLTPATAWASVQYADTQVLAGDTIWLSPGYHIYKNPWTLTASGASGSPILWKGDFLGIQFGMNKGPVFLGTKTRAVSGGFVWHFLKDNHFGVYKDENATTNAIELVDIQWVEFHNIIFHSRGYIISNKGTIRLSSAGAVVEYAGEGIRFYECVVEPPDVENSASCFIAVFTKNDADVIEGNEFRIERCLTIGEVLDITTDESSISAIDLKTTIASCVHLWGDFMFTSRRGIDDVYEVGGGRFLNELFVGFSSAVAFSYGNASARQIYNSLLYGVNLVYLPDGVSTDFGSKNNVFAKGLQDGYFDGIDAASQLALSVSGIGDILYKNLYGWVPRFPFEGIMDEAIQTIGAGRYGLEPMPEYDYYGYPNNRAHGIAWKFLDGSYEAASGTNWGNPGRAVDKDWGNYAYLAGVSEDTLSASGTDISDVTGLIGDNVWVLPIVSWNNLTDAELRYFSITVKYLTETLISGEQIVPLNTSYHGTKAIRVPAPAGGWTRDAISKLRVEITPYKNALSVYARVYNIIVAFELYNAGAIGAVSGISKLKEETIISRSGSSGRLDAWGWWQKAVYLQAGTYTLSVYARYTSTYTGTLPTLELEVPEDGVVYSDTMISVADTWEQLSVAFTLTEGRTVVARLKSYNAAEFGYCYFDDLELS